MLPNLDCFILSTGSAENWISDFSTFSHLSAEASKNRVLFCACAQLHMGSLDLLDCGINWNKTLQNPVVNTGFLKLSVTVIEWIQLSALIKGYCFAASMDYDVIPLNR